MFENADIPPIARCRRRPWLTLTAAAGALLQASVASAQVSVESFRDRIPDDGFAASVEGRLTGNSGNTSGLSAGASSFFGGRSDPHLGFLALAGNYNRYSSEVEAENYFGHLRYNYELVERLFMEAFAQVEHDLFKRLHLRRLLGTGPRFRILETEPVRAYLGTAYMLELESLESTQGYPASDSTAHRWSNYLSAVYRADDRITVSVMGFYQPRFDEISDYRVLLLSSAEFQIDERLSSGLHLNYQYDSAPPPEVRPADVSVINTLGLRF